MSFQIERGLFLLDFADHHAILGVSVEADVKDIRKSYLKIARRLHPDSFVAQTEADKNLAGQLLSKLVNPAWEKLSQEKSRSDHLILLKLKGQAAARKQHELEILSGLAKQLLVSSNPDYFYRTALQDLADRQYQQLDQVVELSAQISELNLVYLITKHGSGETSVADGKKPIYTTASATSTAPKSSSAAPAQPQTESLAEQYLRRAEGFVVKGNYAQATLELRDALKIDPHHSRCHSLMGMVYLRQNQPTMAKIHFNKALSIDPQDPRALEGKQKLEAPTAKAAPQPQAAKATKPASKPDPGRPSGLFGGLFGGKKK
jgi:curved DNA-binding protein CbpA